MHYSLHVRFLTLEGYKSVLVKEQNDQKEEDCMTGSVPEYTEDQNMMIMKLYDDLNEERRYYDNQVVMSSMDNMDETFSSADDNTTRMVGTLEGVKDCMDNCVLEGDMAKNRDDALVMNGVEHNIEVGVTNKPKYSKVNLC